LILQRIGRSVPPLFKGRTIMKRIIVCAALVAAAGCAYSGAAEKAQTGKPAKSKDHWTYADQSKWSETSAEAKTCASGARQSPIDLYEQTLIDEPDIAFSYSAAETVLFNNGHAIEIVAPPGQTMIRNGEVATLLQAHFHDPSEHHLDGVTFPMEMHLVHRRADGGLAVIGVLFREGAENAALAPLWASLPAKLGKEHGATVTFDAAAFLPADRIHFEYLGSLTTPPCTEGVAWFVMHAPLEASAAQIAALKAVIGENARAIQAGNAREVTEGQ
jgi:carbonic anhydrase